MSGIYQETVVNIIYVMFIIKCNTSSEDLRLGCQCIQPAGVAQSECSTGYAVKPLEEDRGFSGE